MSTKLYVELCSSRTPIGEEGCTAPEFHLPVCTGCGDGLSGIVPSLSNFQPVANQPEPFPWRRGAMWRARSHWTDAPQLELFARNFVSPENINRGTRPGRSVLLQGFNILN
jgi:hypothetical protein